MTGDSPRWPILLPTEALDIESLARLTKGHKVAGMLLDGQPLASRR